ncbi:lipoprotein [Candidatus Mancarchaeum acidiphilum]
MNRPIMALLILLNLTSC